MRRSGTCSLHTGHCRVSARLAMAFDQRSDRKNGNDHTRFLIGVEDGDDFTNDGSGEEVDLPMTDSE
jgi:hypothetical protein